MAIKYSLICSEAGTGQNWQFVENFWDSSSTDVNSAGQIAFAKKLADARAALMGQGAQVSAVKLTLEDATYRTSNLVYNTNDPNKTTPWVSPYVSVFSNLLGSKADNPKLCVVARLDLQGGDFSMRHMGGFAGGVFVSDNQVDMTCPGYPGVSFSSAWATWQALLTGTPDLSIRYSVSAKNSTQYNIFNITPVTNSTTLQVQMGINITTGFSNGDYVRLKLCKGTVPWSKLNGTYRVIGQTMSTGSSTNNVLILASNKLIPPGWTYTNPSGYLYKVTANYAGISKVSLQYSSERRRGNSSFQKQSGRRTIRR